MKQEIPAVVVQRLPIYVRTLSLMEQEGMETVSSQQLADRLGMTPAQIRKDLSYFGRFGKQGRGYNIQSLGGELKRILGLNGAWPMVVVGVGNLGRAVINYGGFIPRGFRIAAALDRDARRIGKKAGDLVIADAAKLDEVVQQEGIKIGVVTVPAREAQKVVDSLVDAGVKGILNYAPVAVRVPNGVWVREIDPVLALQSMTFYLKAEDGASTRRRGKGR